MDIFIAIFLLQECNSVFGAYGIDVNYRHLSLVADYMTATGSVRAFNRMAMNTNSSPFQKMSFETSMNFYKDAVLSGKRLSYCFISISEFLENLYDLVIDVMTYAVSGASDTIRSPSARLVVGERIGLGTGLFSLRQKAAFS